MLGVDQRSLFFVLLALGIPVGLQLADMAGLHETDDPIEAAGIELAHEAIRSAEVVVLVQEAGGLSEPLQAIEATDAVTIKIASKADLARDPCDSERVLTSVVSGEGIAELLEQIGIAIVPVDPPAGVAVPFRPDHYRQLAKARLAVEKNDLVAVHERIEALLAGNDFSPGSLTRG